MALHQIRIKEKQCVGCALCVRDCEVGNIEIVNKKAAIKRQDCMMCGHCVAICPKGAVDISGFEDQPVEIKEKAALDAAILLDAIRQRRSVRHFKKTPIPDTSIRQIIEAGRFTPTAVNAQNVSYLILQDGKEEIEKIAVKLFRRLLPIVSPFYKRTKGVVIDENFFFKKAPAVILVMSKDKVNASLAASNMALMAESLGLGVLYSGLFTTAARFSLKIRRKLSLKSRDKIVTALVLGYPDVTYCRTAQRERANVRLFSNGKIIKA